MKYLILMLIFVFCSYSQDNRGRNRTSAGNFYDYEVLPNDQYRLIWGNAHLKRSFPENINAQEAFAAFIFENKHVIILEGSCGRYCGFGLVLPLDSSSAALKFDNPYDFDINKSLVAYPNDDDLQSDTGLVVENYNTGEKHFFVAENCRSFAFNLASQSIYEAKFEDDSLHYKWQYLLEDPSGQSGKPMIMSRTVSIKFQK